MVSEFPVSSVGNILFDDVTYCNFATAVSGELLLATQACNTQPGNDDVRCTFRLLFFDVDCFHGSFVCYKSRGMLTVMHSHIK